MAARLSKLSLSGASMVWLTDALFLRKPTSLLRAERLIPTFPELCGMVALTPLGCTRVNANATKPHLPPSLRVFICPPGSARTEAANLSGVQCAHDPCVWVSIMDDTL